MITEPHTHTRSKFQLTGRPSAQIGVEIHVRMRSVWASKMGNLIQIADGLFGATCGNQCTLFMCLLGCGTAGPEATTRQKHRICTEFIFAYVYIPGQTDDADDDADETTELLMICSRLVDDVARQIWYEHKLLSNHYMLQQQFKTVERRSHMGPANSIIVY